MTAGFRACACILRENATSLSTTSRFTRSTLRQIVAEVDKRAAAQKEMLEESAASAKIEKEKLVQNFKDGLATQQARLDEKEAALKIQVRAAVVLLYPDASCGDSFGLNSVTFSCVKSAHDVLVLPATDRKTSSLQSRSYSPLKS